MSVESDEYVIARLRPHGRALIVPTLVLWVVAFGTPFLIGLVPWPGWNALVIVLALVLVGALFLFPLAAWLSRRYVITNRRITLRSGFGGIRREVLLQRVHDVTLRRTGLQMLFRSGDILISTGGDRAIVLADTPNAALVQRALNELLEQNPGVS